MKEELIRVLNNKLNDINSDIDSLVEINSKIDKENENLSYVSGILDLFKDNDSNNILYFSRLDKDDFAKVLDIIGENAKATFNTDSCNYDGLVYLINGINSGISLELNDEQKNAISYLIDELNNKVDEYSSAIDGYELDKTRYEISDVKELEEKRDNYDKTISNLEKEDYISDTELLMEALNYYDLQEEKVIDLLGYVLEYNANVYKEKGPREVKEENTKEESVEEEVEVQEEPVESGMFTLEDNEHYEKKDEEKEETPSFDDVFHFNTVTETNIEEFHPITFDVEEPKEEETPTVEINEEEFPSQEEYVPKEYDDVRIEDNFEENNESAFDNVTMESPAVIGEIDSDFQDVVNTKEDFEEPLNNGITTGLQDLFDKYGVKEDRALLNELNDGDTGRYQEILEVLKNRDLIDKITGNVLVEMLLNSNADDIIKTLDIIEEDLSVDKEDAMITTRIAIDTIPSVFVTEGGNFHNFVENTRLFKDLGLNLINLFDFSKELFVANNETIVKNYDIVRQYGFELNTKNAKYMLLLPNIGDRLDYYVESVYEDKLKGDTFDGVEYIKEYAAKLNVVTDETIKRIRYSSENGRKVFGSKPKSLAGEITNLKVNALDISSDYLNKFFNNDFANLTGDEVREYVKLIHESSNVGNYGDELDILNPYLKGLRYEIDGINISSNKVLRNYNILRSYGMDKKKALEFAVCYNLVITKEEYDRLNSKLEEIGGNL